MPERKVICAGAPLLIEEGKKMNERPRGVRLVAILTLLSSAALFLLFGLYMVLAVVGGPHTVDWLYWILANPPILISIVLSAYAFFLSTGMFSSTSKYVWYASIVFWLALLVFFSWWNYGIWRNVGISYNEDGSSTWQLVYGWQYGIIIVTLLPFVYGIGCFAYFQTAKIKHYFKIKL